MVSRVIRIERAYLKRAMHRSNDARMLTVQPWETGLEVFVQLVGGYPVALPVIDTIISIYGTTDGRSVRDSLYKLATTLHLPLAEHSGRHEI